MQDLPIQNERRDYRRRMRWAVLIALIVHATFLLLPVRSRSNGALLLPPPSSQEPVVVSLQPRDDPKRLITPGAPADAPVDRSTDLIAERASKAQDATPGDGGGITPDAGAVGPIEDMVSVIAPPPSVAPKPVPAASREDAAPEPEPNKKPHDSPRPVAAARPGAQVPKSMEKVDSAEPAIPESSDMPSDASVQLAKAELPQISQHVMGKTQGPEAGGVKSLGFLSFEAQQSEFAPYLRAVRDRVEKRWKTIMHVGYSGVSTAEAVVDCAISPDGKLTRVSIVEPGTSATFAGLCKQAIEQAGPFGPFPFNIPEVYQNQNIEIRWTFSFL